MAFIQRRNEQTFGFDLDGNSVKLVQLRRDHDGYKVVGASRTDIASSQSDPAEDQYTLSRQALEQGLQASGIRAHQAVASVGGEDVALSTFELPRLDRKELEQAILLDAEQTCPFDFEASVVDFCLFDDDDADTDTLSTKSDQVCGVAVSALKQAIENQRRLLKETGINCVLMDVDDLALLNCFNETEKLEENQSAALLHMGDKESNIIILRQGCDPFFRKLGRGQDAIIEAFALEHDQSPEAIKQVLFDSQAQEDAELNIDLSMTRICQPLINDMMETIRYYYIQHKVNTIDRVLICGDLSLVTQFNEVLDINLPLPVEVWNPFAKMRYQVPSSTRELLEQSGSALAVAAGLAMRTI